MLSEIRVRVEISSAVTGNDGETTQGNSTCRGCLRRDAAGTLLTYTEEGESGKIFNRLEIGEGEVTVIRTGALSSRLTFRPGLRDVTVCRIPPLSFDFGVKTREVGIVVEERGLSLSLCFTSDFGGADSSTVLRICAREETVCCNPS